MARIFCLTDSNGKLLDPSVQATVLAKYSRSPLSATEVLETLTPEEADRFQDKWFVGYGHSSVAELAMIPLCFEGVSIIASKFIESFQRPGYSEKSTRYQVFSGDSFVLPPGAPETTKAFSSRLYGAYDKLYPRVLRRCAEVMGKDPNDPKVREDRTVKARAFDNVRYLLPAGTGTSVGLVGNARDIRYLVSSALGHRNPEIRQIGEDVIKAVAKISPVFLNKVEPDQFELPIRSLGALPDRFSFESPDWYVELHGRNLMPSPGLVQARFEAMIADRHGMAWSVFKQHMDSRPKRAVPRAFRTVPIAFDIMMDYGAYRDMQRHRRCEQYSEPLNTCYGFTVPDDIMGSELEDEYCGAMSSVDTYQDELVVHDPDLSQYVIPLGYLHRSVFDMDLAELYYIVELRTQPQGHISYRRVAYEMYKLGMELYPGLMRWCRAVSPDSIGVHS